MGWPTCSAPDVAGLQTLSAFACTTNSERWWEVQSKNIWRSRSCSPQHTLVYTFCLLARKSLGWVVLYKLFWMPFWFHSGCPGTMQCPDYLNEKRWWLPEIEGNRGEGKSSSCPPHGSDKWLSILAYCLFSCCWIMAKELIARHVGAIRKTGEMHIVFGFIILCFSGIYIFKIHFSSYSFNRIIVVFVTHACALLLHF